MDHSLALGTICSLLIAAGSVAFAVFSHRRQVNASVYLELTRQLHELYKRMPKSGGADAQHAQRTENTEALVFDSLQLIRSAFTLSEAGYFSGKLWSNLRADAEKSLKKPVFHELWPKMKTEFLNDPSFIAYVDRVQSR